MSFQWVSLHFCVFLLLRAVFNFTDPCHCYNVGGGGGGECRYFHKVFREIWGDNRFSGDEGSANGSA